MNFYDSKQNWSILDIYAFTDQFNNFMIKLIYV